MTRFDFGEWCEKQLEGQKIILPMNLSFKEKILQVVGDALCSGDNREGIIEDLEAVIANLREG